MKNIYYRIALLLFAFLMSLFCSIPVYSGIVANGISGQTQTAYPGSNNVPIYVWCSNTNNAGSLTAAASISGACTFISW